MFFVAGRYALASGLGRTPAAHDTEADRARPQSASTDRRRPNGRLAPDGRIVEEIPLGVRVTVG